MTREMKIINYGYWSYLYTLSLSCCESSLLFFSSFFMYIKVCLKIFLGQYLRPHTYMKSLHVCIYHSFISLFVDVDLLKLYFPFVISKTSSLRLFFPSKSVHICSYFLILDFPVFLHELPFFLLLILSHHHYTSYHRFSQEFHLQGDLFFLFFTPSNRTLLPRTRDL